MLMKLARNIFQKEGRWAVYTRAKYFTKNDDIIKYYKKSSMWSGIKAVLPEVMHNSCWSLGSGAEVDTWRDWTGQGVLRDYTSLAHIPWNSHKSKVSDLLHESVWLPDHETENLLNVVGVNMNEMYVKTAGNIFGKTQALAWRIIHNAVPTEEKIQETKSFMAALPPTIRTVKHSIMISIQEAAARTKRVMKNLQSELVILHSLGKSGMLGIGAVFRSYTGSVLGVLVENIGISSSYYAECFCIVVSLFIAFTQRWYKVFLVSDSSAAIAAFKNNKIPWK
ncbi:hypothetical protein GIB67_016411 [Kingdonia uniflora]|uniref:RNase H type-1 domain-containing protein n=1 Tax=Kingdonia uniflora TaxID=39325 RepID=A0A7J7MGW7_9MAGN|nr:hypothetical protein GIB67_016411 [Kingdonia uniflora]